MVMFDFFYKHISIVVMFDFFYKHISIANDYRMINDNNIPDHESCLEAMLEAGQRKLIGTSGYH